jgi:hypothetical protein
MKAVKVQYTVKEEYAETNKKNIEQVMSDLRKLNNPGVKYSSYVLNDGKTFVHLGIYSDEEAMSVATNLDSFKKFQMELKESQPESPPKADDLNLVASAYDIF